MVSWKAGLKQDLHAINQPMSMSIDKNITKLVTGLLRNVNKNPKRHKHFMLNSVAIVLFRGGVTLT